LKEHYIRYAGFALQTLQFIPLFSGSGYKMPRPADIFTSELTVLLLSLQYIGVIEPPEKCLILTDSLSSVDSLFPRKIWHWTHPLVYECKQLCSGDLLWNGFEVAIMWISSHMGLKGNELVDERARHAALNGAVFDIPLPPVDFQGLARSVLLRE
jgi:hypothetical protein